MRRGRKLDIVTGLLVMLSVVVSTLPAMAQVVSISAQGGALSNALADFSKRTGVNVVYADRIVLDTDAFCQYSGNDFKSALD